MCNEQDINCIQCLDGCYCNDGYVRDVKGGNCVRLDECKAPNPPNPPKKCSDPNESYICKCADSVCDQPDINCIRCTEDCYCNDGYVRDVEGGTCIKANACPKPSCSNAHEVYDCACSDKVCNQPDKICIQCLNGCYCETGYVRDVEGGTCIKENACPKPNCPGINENFQCKCADKICNEPIKICKRCLDGCYCDDGYSRDVDGGVCILDSLCWSFWSH